jgi:hypothetical protein
MILDWVKEKIGFGEKAEKVQEDAQKERSSIFTEVWESALVRYFPNVSKILDMSSAVGVIKRDPSAGSWQSEFETITAFSLLVPDFLLAKLTNPLAHSETFQKIVENWPLMNQSWIDKIKDPDCDPDDVISILRIMNQDIVAGKVTVESVLDKIPGLSALGTLAGTVLK